MKDRVVALEGKWSPKDYLGRIRTVLGIDRNNYRVEPGLYSMGSPGSRSPVLVTANYKLTVDILRREVASLDCWILVLDTGGVNVWCAAGKGTFGTEELINRIGETELDTLVEEKRLILPQLGAPGVDSREVRSKTGYRVLFGPVEARDIPPYIEQGFHATPAMRKKNFPAGERGIVGSTHMAQGVKWTLLIAALFVLSDILFMKLPLWRLPEIILRNGGSSLLALAGGSLFFSLLIPYLPGRAFSLKGLFPAVLLTPLLYVILSAGQIGSGFLYVTGKVFFLLIFVDYQALNLTGSSTYTSLSGVLKEMKYSLPAYIAGAVTSIALILTGGFIL